MAQPWHALIPFSPPNAGGIAVAAQAAVIRAAGGQAQLQLRYRLAGAAAVRLGEPSPASPSPPQRRDGLWQQTCLEAFLAPLGEQSYWEINLAPSGDWNVYRLEAYRLGLRADSFYSTRPLVLQRQGDSSANLGSPDQAHPNLERGSLDPGSLELSLCCPLPPALAPAGQRAGQLEVGLSAVIETHDGSLSYWALNHPGAEADFHHRHGWTLRL